MFERVYFCFELYITVEAVDDLFDFIDGWEAEHKFSSIVQIPYFDAVTR